MSTNRDGKAAADKPDAAASFQSAYRVMLEDDSLRPSVCRVLIALMYDVTFTGNGFRFLDLHARTIVSILLVPYRVVPGRLALSAMADLHCQVPRLVSLTEIAQVLNGIIAPFVQGHGVTAPQHRGCSSAEASPIELLSGLFAAAVRYEFPVCCALCILTCLNDQQYSSMRVAQLLS